MCELNSAERRLSKCAYGSMQDTEACIEAGHNSVQDVHGSRAESLCIEAGHNSLQGVHGSRAQQPDHAARKQG